MDWTLDLGNSALKRSAYANLAFESALRSEIANDETLVATLAAEVAPLDLRCVAVSSVASEARTDAVLSLLREAGARCVTSPEALLENGVREPETVGVDRLFAGLGAMALLPQEERAAVVLDAGTALTVDLFERGEGELYGRFLGGAIAPGPALTAEALARGGARLFAVDSEHSVVPARGQNTTEALTAGVVFGLRGTARELVAELQQDYGAAELPIFVTGGARALLDGVFESARVRVEPRLVDRGLFETLAFELAR